MSSLQVSPELLHRSANEMDRLLAAHRAAHTKAHGLISAAMSGWVGGAASALDSESTQWQGHSRHVENESTHYRDAFDQIGYAFAGMEEQTAVNILGSRPQAKA
ncbi:WXG100 family type VII secretion target [Mycobacteroides abscessus subsp. abscessus]|uniref:WXG100 family type VII secretion target n=1 Tax=Mycobacteroides abscessus TaxID=36809 RepID=UPI0009A8F700|nr:WXG100 family type VII secretion target [Mycobacteroides abscessus]QSM05017.1 WXG motif protein [Mycobacterium phage prophiGD12-2]MBN7355477.1 WXG100 family type VII secretion target [Mycobacteroides abscessus subsp. abscessus]MBN7360256.1 WXG100 family type VII secretion target [Mycobacteroides abscessus subsp. abscessus]MBN7474734.1 WXG100 family type VII secretion target [Mycobacteroides abscessus subsp. abscessus]SLI65643.1 WXG100 family type VII secretion target [Mycobacteroides absces